MLVTLLPTSSAVPVFGSLGTTRFGTALTTRLQSTRHSPFDGNCARKPSCGHRKRRLSTNESTGMQRTRMTASGVRRRTIEIIQQQPLIRACGIGAMAAFAGIMVPRLVPQFAAVSPAAAPDRSYWLTRSVFLRCLGGIYAVAFSVARTQNKALIGDQGITPARTYMRNILKKGANGNVRRAMERVPTLFWILPLESSLDPWLDRTAVAGLALSLFLMVLGAANVPMILAIWILYHTLVNVGQHWYGFGWESQLLETTFLAAFAVPLFSLGQFPPACPPPAAIPWLYRWLGFRIMFGAGLIKIRGDKVWKDLTAMDYHYETQPLPNPISFFLHQAPQKLHRFETAANHVVELGASWLVLFPWRALSMVGGGVQTCFQIAIIISGNLSFLNYLTILPFIWCFDDRALKWMLSCLKSTADISAGSIPPSLARSGASWFLVGMIGCLSAPVVRNMASKKQSMNRTFEPMRIVNTYGAFGSVSKMRPEIIIKGALEYEGDETTWREYEFRSKPGPLFRPLPWVSPYHRRLDWCLWIAALGPPRFSAWFPRLLLKLMDNDRQISKLLKANPFLGGESPKYIKADLYHYSFTTPGSEERKAGQVWTRRYLGNFWRMASRKGLVDAISPDS